MINKLIHILVIVVLFTASTGFAISQHFCGDHLVSVFVNSADEPCCGEKSPCCQNETDYLHMDEDGFIPALTTVEVKQAITLLHSSDLDAYLSPKPFLVVTHHHKIIFLPPPASQTILATLQTYLL